MKRVKPFREDKCFSINGVQTNDGIKYRLDEAPLPPLPEVLISVTFQGIAEDDLDSGVSMSVKQKDVVLKMLQDISELIKDTEELPEEIKLGIVVPFRNRD